MDRKRGTVVLKMVMTVFLVMSLCMYYVWQRVQTVRYGYSIEKKEKILAKAVKENKEIQYRIESITTPDQIEKILSDQHVVLGTPAPGERLIVTVNFDKKEAIVLTEARKSGSRLLSLLKVSEWVES